MAADDLATLIKIIGDKHALAVAADTALDAAEAAIKSLADHGKTCADYLQRVMVTLHVAITNTCLTA